MPIDPRPSPRRGALADGREILYFDDAGTARSAPAGDARRIEAPPGHAELRLDRLSNEWVIVAAARQDRTFLPAASACPLCPSRPGGETEIPDAEYDVAVFQNRFPSLPAAREGEAPVGRSEVICYSSDHATSFSALPAERLRTIGRAWAHRTRELAADSAVAAVLCFENRGEEIGVTLHHPHGQVYAYPFVPPRIGRLVATADEHRNRTGTCLGCDLLAEELAAATRIVATTEMGVAYVPAAARWPWEVHIVPRRHVGDLPSLAPAELDDLVRLQADTLARLDGLFERPAPYMAGWLQAPRDAELHLRLQIVSPLRAADRLKYLAGSESLAGAFINDIRPEEAAARLRAARGRSG
jgi:UDPglucose--hexose-1-phosphate uridylyltransferase